MEFGVVIYHTKKFVLAKYEGPTYYLCTRKKFAKRLVFPPFFMVLSIFTIFFDFEIAMFCIKFNYKSSFPLKIFYIY